MGRGAHGVWGYKTRSNSTSIWSCFLLCYSPCSHVCTDMHVIFLLSVMLWHVERILSVRGQWTEASSFGPQKGTGLPTLDRSSLLDTMFHYDINKWLPLPSNLTYPHSHEWEIWWISSFLTLNLHWPNKPGQYTNSALLISFFPNLYMVLSFSVLLCFLFCKKRNWILKRTIKLFCSYLETFLFHDKPTYSANSVLLNRV